MRENLFIILIRRLSSFPIQLWRNLGTNQRYRTPLAIGYAVGAVSTLYSFLSIFYQFNIDLGLFLSLPFQQFFLDQVLPFLAAPLNFIGFKISQAWQGLIAISSIGGAVMANAEFRTKCHFLKYIFTPEKLEPNLDPKDWKNLPKLDPPKHTMLTRFIVLIASLVLAYTFLGLVVFVVYIGFGVYFIIRDIKYFIAFLFSNILYLPEHLLAPYERWGDDEYWGTRWFLFFFNKRRKLDEFVERSCIDFWRIDSLDPNQEHWNVMKKSISDGARVVANTVWLFAIVATLSGFSCASQ
jgi:hypothetical protein